MAANDISITIKVPPRGHQRLHEMAKAKGYRAAAYAQMLFEAAFAARIGQERGAPVSDTELDEQVRAVLCLAGQFDVPAIARALGLSEALVSKILDGWRSARRKTSNRKD